MILSSLWFLALFLTSAEGGIIYNDHSIDLSGEVHCQYGVGFQANVLNNNLSISSEGYPQNHLNTNTSIKLSYEGKNISNLDYGLQVKIGARSPNYHIRKTNIKNQIKGYLKGRFGHIEIGNTAPVGNKIEISTQSMARATGGVNGDWRVWAEKNGAFYKSDVDSHPINMVILNAPKLPIALDEGNNANKINFIAPRINNFTFGFTYIPDCKISGINYYKYTPRKQQYGGYKKILQPAIKYEKVLDNKIKFTLALLGEFGEARDVRYYLSLKDALNAVNMIAGSRNSLRAWQFGLGTEYNGISLAAIYGDIGKSGTLKEDIYNKKGGKEGKYLYLCSGYSQDNYGVSVSYIKSKRSGTLPNNRETQSLIYDINSVYGLEAISVGADYRIGENCVPYIEATRFVIRECKEYKSGGGIMTAGVKFVL